MAASLNVPQLSSIAQQRAQDPVAALVPARGVLTLRGYGIDVRVERGHLLVGDGIGATRERARFARIGHGLRRLVVIGADGAISLAALRWLADQKVAFTMLNRDGSVLAATGPVLPSDSRLRRAQALAHVSGVALDVSKYLIERKLTAQARIARMTLNDHEAATAIEGRRSAVSSASDEGAVRLLESQGAIVYWALWRSVQVHFPQKDLARVPGHWRGFKTRTSPLTASPRLAADPVNAILNYLYALLAGC